ncbi:hypothetical protein BRD08_09405 [Halobacteriales archaeon SW_10_66_29]|nr:MAG: hypothetical protein BRD08_09405 [Halobacteriales archaeon SW_10_66_29]
MPVFEPADDLFGSRLCSSGQYNEIGIVRRGNALDSVGKLQLDILANVEDLLLDLIILRVTFIRTIIGG